MTPKLTEELREALRQSGGAVEVQDDQSNKLYVIAAHDLASHATSHRHSPSAG